MHHGTEANAQTAAVLAIIVAVWALAIFAASRIDTSKDRHHRPRKR